MILWTIQSKKAYENMIYTGYLRANEEYLIFEGEFKDSYLWLADQMRKRIGNSPSGVIYPVWAWYQWEGKRKRPDMRIHGRSSEKGIPIVLLTIDVPEDKVLLSDFDYWHAVLNDFDLIFSEHDEDCTEDDKKKSWENIFDISCSFTGEKHHSVSTQATLWEIKREWVVKVEQFQTR